MLAKTASLAVFLLFASANAFISPSVSKRCHSLVNPKDRLFVLAEGATDNKYVKDDNRNMNRDRHTIFVGNLPLDASSNAVKELFQQHGEVQLVTMPLRRDTNQPRGFAFVDMATPDDMQAAIKNVDGQTFGGRILRVSQSLPKEDVPRERPPRTTQRTERAEIPDGYKKVYVGNIPFDCTRQDLLDCFSPYGEISEVFIPVDLKTGRGRGFAFVTMKEEDAEKAIEATNGKEFAGRKMAVGAPLPPGERAPARNNDRTKLYVGNLSFYTVADTLVDIFQEFGTVHDCYMPEDPSTGGSRGFGFVTMDKDAASRAVEKIDGCEVDGRIIRVNEAQRKKFSRND